MDDEAEAEAMAEEYARLSSLLKKQILLPALVLEDEASERYDITTVGGGNHDLSVLVGTRRLHQTQHAAEGVRTRDSADINRPSESIRCKLIREMNALIRQDQIRAPGTGQDRKLRWQTPAQGGTSTISPGHQQSALALTGNSANAATVAGLRTKKVPFSCHILALPGFMCI